MNSIFIKDFIINCNGKIIVGNSNLECQSFSKDTRSINPGDIYIGIKGENFDGNQFYLKAFENGASACILDQDFEAKIDVNSVQDKTIVLVENTVKALQQIAEYKLSLYNIPIVAVTGSVGKTSTKDMIYSVMKRKFNVHKTEGNHNNEIGLPLTILELNDHNALLLEMGMNHAGEISILSKIAKPNIAVINNISPAHIGNLGSMNNILKAKLEILDGMNHDGTLIINNDNGFLKNANIRFNNIFTYGIDTDSDIKCNNLTFVDEYANYTVRYKENDYNFHCKVSTKNYVANSLAAISVGIKLDIPLSEIAEGLKNFELTGSRLEHIPTTNGITLINDAYNANIDSMKNAIDYLINSKGNRKIAILGDILEQGSYAEYYHRGVGEYAAEKGIDFLIAIGPNSEFIYESAKSKMRGKIEYFKTKEQSYDFIKSYLKSGDAVIVKASNGMKFIDIVDFIKNL